MTTITREQAQKIIEAADEVISALAGTNEDVHPGSDNMLRLWDDLNDRYAPPEVVRELARIALASLEAEPVLYQSCTRPTWNSGVPWTEWKERSRECYEDDLRFTDTPDHAGWINKCRKLYTTPPAPIALEAIENAIEYIRSIAFHIDEDDYHGKHIAYFMRQALVWLEGHSCSNDRQGKAENQPVRGNQTAESNRGNEWTGNPDIDNAIIMLDRIDTLESCDDDRIEAVKAVLRRLAGNYPDIPDSSVPAPGKGVTGERIRIKPHVYRELVNRLHDTAIKCAGTQQLRERISRVLGDVITPDHHKQAEKSGLERCRLEAALNIKPGHTLGIIDALLVHKMARALLPLVAEKHEVDHANES
ncbi:hypothetical protein [Escherichia coli]|jgi:hypothetical protein|uniref:hypothetical protein n=1 Tax=Escherichia coli TaxID=562 RepID=UPI000BE94344|nr:hypothetical protein [Escherichia coli]EBS4982538.1 hypothetical protein [Salmonella enterica subsp. enterica serovar Oslo]HAK6600068.1 hypothetical protein [Salmonella enterica]EIQ6139721.1 hypothetical protein [Escherichia coli]EJE5567209.1 hypothetical protein [Escherichia coli]EJK8069721.1 hypothetical protein [Escherichia coli]